MVNATASLVEGRNPLIISALNGSIPSFITNDANEDDNKKNLQIVMMRRKTYHDFTDFTTTTTERKQ